MEKNKKIRVLIVDDSKIVRDNLSQILESDTRFQVMATASDPYEAARQIAREVPDVITLDLEMPRMNGLTFLRKLMNQHPVPVVIVSSFTSERKDLGIRALSLGAAEIVSKPGPGGSENIKNYSIQLREAVYAASMQNIFRQKEIRGKAIPVPREEHLVFKKIDVQVTKLILIGASTGGTSLIADMLKSLRPDLPPILVVQHMPGEFTGAYAHRLDEESPLIVKEAEKNEVLKNGHVYIANGYYHLLVKKVENDYVCDLIDGELVNRHRPSIDVLFNSVAALASVNAMAIILTGMGADGARGMLELKRRGAICIAQDEKSCVVYGMPKEAVALNAVTVIGTPGEIVEWMNNFS